MSIEKRACFLQKLNKNKRLPKKPCQKKIKIIVAVSFGQVKFVMQKRGVGLWEVLQKEKKQQKAVLI